MLCQYSSNFATISSPIRPGDMAHGATGRSNLNRLSNPLTKGVGNLTLPSPPHPQPTPVNFWHGACFSSEARSADEIPSTICRHIVGVISLSPGPKGQLLAAGDENHASCDRNSFVYKDSPSFHWLFRNSAGVDGKNRRWNNPLVEPLSPATL